MTYSPMPQRFLLPQKSLIVPNITNIHSYTGTNTAAGTANMGYYQPFDLAYDETLVSMSFYCATGTNNHDLGIYDATGERLTSRGSTATTATAVNTWTLSTPLRLYSGNMYWAAFSTAGTKTVLRLTGNSVSSPRFGRAIQAIGAVALPATATFASPTTNSFVPILKLTFA